MLDEKFNKYAHFKTEDQIIDLHNRAVKDYHEQTASSERVLEITVRCTGDAMYDYEGHYSKRKPGIPDWFGNIGYNEGMGFAIEWSRQLKVKKGELRIYDVDENWEPRSYRTPDKDVFLIAWTPEREEFLKSLDNSLQQLIFKIGAFFGDKQQLLNFMDSGKKLLE